MKVIIACTMMLKEIELCDIKSPRIISADRQTKRIEKSQLQS